MPEPAILTSPAPGRPMAVTERTTALTQLLFALGVGLCALNMLAAFIGLHASSAWRDELATLDYSNPSIASAGAVIRGALPDPHPPTYALLIWAIRHLPGDTVVLMRASSACFGIAALLLLAMMARGRLNRVAILGMIGLAVTSWPWFYFAQEGRSYAAMLLISSLVAALIFRISDRQQAGDAAAWDMAALFGVLGVGAITHNYFVMVAAAVLGWRVLASRSWREALYAALLCALALAPAIIVSRLQLPYMAEKDGTWFQATPAFLTAETLQMTKNFVGSPGALIVGLALAVLLLRYRPRLPWPAGWREAGDWVRSPWTGFCLIIVGTIILTLAYSVLLRPVFSFRVGVVLLPLVWLLWGRAIDRTIAAGTSERLLLIVIVPCLLIGSLRIAGRWLPMKEEWRASAQAIAALPACNGADLPVASPGHILDSNYAFYLPAGHTFLSIGRPALLSGQDSPAYRRLLDRSLAGPSADVCPILLWSAHVLTDADARAITVRLKGFAAVHGRHVRMIGFPHADFGNFILPTPWGAGARPTLS